MSEPRYPNESQKYREARDALLNEEQALIDKVKARGGEAPQTPVRRAS